MSSRKALINKQTGKDNEEADLVSLEKILNSMDITQRTSHTSISDDADKKCSLLEIITRTVRISCQPPSIPFTIQGGSAEGYLILVELVLHPDLLNVLATDDIILSISGRFGYKFHLLSFYFISLRYFLLISSNMCRFRTSRISLPIDSLFRKVSGMLLRDVRRLLEGLFAMNESFYMEIVSKNSIPSSITEILAGEDYSELQIIIRNNVYQKTVPYTTRPPRSGEVDGVHYKFVDVSTFRQLRENNQLLEHGHYQGFIILTNFYILFFIFLFYPFLFSHIRFSTSFTCSLELDNPPIVR
ncbi:hypothetical protein X798_02239 [Onchocerca flexuosa]|uniref:Guanylate kinase-like domain-containing protein n=1 Tax=Onchocerca flexuosa TaxID=387005 RepID=A0A238C115_9BILA|nr:hypothetical protein X798_02239 [Onchocerca flexuosa]